MRPKLRKHISECGIAYHRRGSGPPLVLIHGVGLRAESWYQYVEPLSEHFELFIPDLPGHGDSDPLGVDYRNAALANYMLTLESFIASITQQAYFLCGHSLGALIAIELAAQPSNKVLGMVALNAIYGRSDSAHQAVKTRAERLRESDNITGVTQTIERWFSSAQNADNQTHAAHCEYWLRTNDLNGYATAYKSFADQRGPANETVKSIPCPSVYMTGALDPNSTPIMTHQLARLGTKARANVVENAGHMMPLTHADQVIDELLELKSLTNHHPQSMSKR